MFKHFLTAMIAAAAVIAQPAFAQDSSAANGTQTSTSGSTSNSNTQVIAIAGGKGEFGGTYNTPAHQSVDYSGHTWTTPSVQGSYFGGTNPCLVGTGGGVAGGPIGISFNAGRSDEACTRRSDAAAWHAMGFDNIAVARMCQDEKNADAFYASTGLACPGSNAKGRYKMSDGTLAPEMRLVSDAHALPPTARTAAVDMNNPAVQAAIRQQAVLMAQQMVAQRAQGQVFPQPTFDPNEKNEQAPDSQAPKPTGR
jgi:hypothetical protein